MGKKWALALAVLATGVVGALCFRKDPARPAAASHTAQEDVAFGKSVARRLPADSAHKATAAKTAQRRASQPFRVPTAAAAPFSEGDSPAPEMSANYQRTFGSLLNPLPQTELSAADADRTAAGLPPGEESAARFHKIVDGDTLMKLAGQYLGSSDRYLEIYESNRAVLSSPDLLPIGAVLKIPSREQKPVGEAGANGDPATVGGQEENRPLVPIPHDALRGSQN